MKVPNKQVTCPYCGSTNCKLTLSDFTKSNKQMKKEHQEDFSIVLTDETRKIVDAYIKRKREIRAKLLERKAKKA